MEQVRNVPLMRLMESIAETREAKNLLIQDEKKALGAALTIMQTKQLTAYRHAGLELVLVPGDVHLRVRLVREQANSDPAPSTSDDATESDADIADGQDPGAIGVALTTDIEDKDVPF